MTSDEAADGRGRRRNGLRENSHNRESRHEHSDLRAVFGLVFLAVGVAGFIPAWSSRSISAIRPSNMVADSCSACFPVNLLHNAVHILFGLWGLLASRSLGGAVTYARGVAIIYAVLTIAGFVPSLYTLFGMVPLYGNDIWLHAVLALVAAYFGWVHRNPASA